MKAKLSVMFALGLAASAALPMVAHGADTYGQSGASKGSESTSGTGSSATSSSMGSGTTSADLSLFQQLDTNKDGVVDQTEANKSAQTKGDFKSMDLNGDGRVSAEEWASFHRGK